MTSQRASYRAMNWRAAKLSYYQELPIYVSRSCSQPRMAFLHNWETWNGRILLCPTCYYRISPHFYEHHLDQHMLNAYLKILWLLRNKPERFAVTEHQRRFFFFPWTMGKGGEGSLAQIILHLIWSAAWLTNTSSTKHCSEINAFLKTVFVDTQRRTAPRRLGGLSQNRLVWLCMIKSGASKQIWRMFQEGSVTGGDLRLLLLLFYLLGWSEFLPQLEPSENICVLDVRQCCYAVESAIRTTSIHFLEQHLWQ